MELVTVIILVGVLGALVLPRFIGTGGFSERAAVDQALSGIRHAQQQAMSRGARARFRYDGGQYWVEYLDSGSWEAASPRSPWELPGETSFLGYGDLEFDGLGALEGSPCPRKVSLGGGTIKVYCETGFASAG